MTTLNTLAKPRKSLADQIDRLDEILDGLSDALGESVAEAVGKSVGGAVKDAVRDALVEALTSPEVITVLRDAVNGSSNSSNAQPEAVEKPRGWWPRVHEWASGMWKGFCGWCCSTWQGLRKKGKVWRQQVGAGCLKLGKQCRQWLPVILKARVPLMVALVVAVAFGLLGFFCGPVVAAIMCSISGFALTLLALLVWSAWTTVPKLESLPWNGAAGNQGGEVVPPEGCG